MKKEIKKTIENGRMLKRYGSWMYCECGHTLGYLCYTTYEYFKFTFTCKCGTEGSFELGEKPEQSIKNDDDLTLIKNRMCCKNDHSPLFSIVEKHLNAFTYEVVCKECHTQYKNCK